MSEHMVPPAGFSVLCQLLNPFIPSGHIVLNNVDWPILLKMADTTHVLPELYQGLLRHQLFASVPVDIANTLTELYEFLLLRSKLVKAQCDDITTAFNAAGIVPVWLKGAALLYQADWPRCARIMNDIDVWVPDPAQHSLAIEVLNKLGYVNKQQHELWEESHHFSPFFHPKKVATVELHKHVIRPALSALLPNSLCAQGIEYQQQHNMHYGVLSLPHRITQSFIQCSLMASPSLDTGFIRLMKVVDFLRLMYKAGVSALPPDLLQTLAAHPEWQRCAAQFTQVLAQHFAIANPLPPCNSYQRKLYALLSGEHSSKTVVRKIALFKKPAVPLSYLLTSPNYVWQAIKARLTLLIRGKF
ncbi:nucleotidyltransferase family protein [Alishewanella sp. HL-SH06]|uniref:nucleotidyltransferase family protein n=1 Tax=Alishewanella sp. HL-SH06 TaxID=3461144 RepID=UPI0040414791